jgi:hypothetical protein
MQIPAQVKPAAWGAAGGAVAAMIIGFAWGGWVTGGTSEKNAGTGAGVSCRSAGTAEIAFILWAGYDFLAAAAASIASTTADAHPSATLRRYLSATLETHPALTTNSVRE